MSIKRKLFKFLISVYPRPYREHFEHSMLQIFDDMEQDGSASGWFIIQDAAISIPMQYINYLDEIMKNKLNRNIVIALLGALVILLGLGVSQVIILQKAHSTFDNYYAFRGCTQLVQKTDTYGICKIASGVTIKIDEINGKWYLDGDGPGVW